MLSSLQSSARQRFADFEAVIVDDASTDGAADEIGAVIDALGDRRFRLQRQLCNRGLTRCLIEAIAKLLPHVSAHSRRRFGRGAQLRKRDGDSAADRRRAQPLAGAVADPMQLTAMPLINPQGGYATYVLPAAFVLILQQTLLIGSGLLGTLPGAAPAAMSGGRLSWGHALASGSVKLLALMALEAIILPVYLIVLPNLYGLPRLGSLATIITLSIPFVLAVGALGLLLAAIFRLPLAVQLATAAVGMPFFFLAGFAWPSEAIVAPLNSLSLLIPSTPAIDELVRASQLGASLSDVRESLLLLCGLACLYGALALCLAEPSDSIGKWSTYAE